MTAPLQDTPTPQVQVNPLDDEQRAELDLRFTYHAPKGDQPMRYLMIRDKARELAELIMQVSSRPSREQSLAITHVENAVMWANAGIARNG